MLTSPNAPTEQPTDVTNTQEQDTTPLMLLDNHLNDLPPEIQTQFEDGFRKYDDLPELFGIVMPEAYEYFKLIQQGVRGNSQQPQQNSPETSQMAPLSEEPAQTPLLGSANSPAKATSALSGLTK